MATALKDVRIQLQDQRLFREHCYIDGAWIAAEDGRTVKVTDPATGEIIGTVPSLGVVETRRAIEAAERALPAWRAKTGKERAQILRRWFELVMAHADDLAYLMTREQGKPVAEAKGEIAYAASFLEWFSEEAKRVYGDVIPQTVASRRILVLKQPVGVCAAITPWNFPAAMITRKAGPALAVGCTMVVKPASATPYSALALAELAERAGVPKGVFNVITGSAGTIGTELCTNKKVRKVSFTGSTEVGKILLKQCADTVKRVSMELGGHAPFIVFDDADLDKAVEGAIACKFRNCGQTCVCTNRIYVQAGVFDTFAQKLAAATAKLKVGPGTGADVQIGPLIDENAVQKVEEHIGDATAKGASILLGGKRHALGGHFFEPTVLANCNAEMKIAHEETFGPVAPLFRFETEEEVIRLANASDVGLAGYFYTRDLGRAFRVAEALEVGLVGVNDGVISNEVAPFGGVKESGMGREGSKYGIDEYLEIKYVSLGGIG
ncbi:NAD-dependent succinate-semialdehyde dehydrogenase [Benzoatithermus flavus]|uniref:NAD-dependent succinate-semialdehyde dehydrogenase n=1 Tax=Benzoatithermus flavus TaxID=3108223 RepID=A0ABU8XN14_9PROT